MFNGSTDCVSSMTDGFRNVSAYVWFVLNHWPFCLWIHHKLHLQVTQYEWGGEILVLTVVKGILYSCQPLERKQNWISTGFSFVFQKLDGYVCSFTSSLLIAVVFLIVNNIGKKQEQLLSKKHVIIWDQGFDTVCACYFNCKLTK